MPAHEGITPDPRRRIALPPSDAGVQADAWFDFGGSTGSVSVQQQAAAVKKLRGDVDKAQSQLQELADGSRSDSLPYVRRLRVRACGGIDADCMVVLDHDDFIELIARAPTPRP